MINNSALAKQLYKNCNNCDPKESMLMPYKVLTVEQGYTIYSSAIVGIMINHYANNDFKNDWIPFTKENFHMKEYENIEEIEEIAIQQLGHNGHIEFSMFPNEPNKIRLVNDMFYDPSIYKNKKEASN